MMDKKPPSPSKRKPPTNGKLFEKGKSGNPGGRPKLLRNIVEMAREHTEASLTALVEIVGDAKASPSARVSAAATLLERGWGKAPANVRVELDDIRQLTDDQLAAAIAGLAAEAGVAGIVAGGGEEKAGE